MPAIESVHAEAVSIPTDEPESDGTLEWDSTGVVIVEVGCEGERGLGWTYNDASAAQLIESKLASVIEGREALDVPASWMAMRRELRNVGTTGVGASAIAAVDVALWDLAARLRGISLVRLLGCFRDSVPVYGSGGFCSYDDERLTAQLRGWADQDIEMVKIKVGREPDADPHRVEVARDAVGPDIELFVDANGAYERRQAIAWTQRFADLADVRWMEEPVSSNDPAGLRAVREQAPPAVTIAAGEYVWRPADARALLDAQAVDVLQLDATRCLGLTGFRSIACAAAAREVAVSAHCAPALHVHACCAAENVRHLEYFHDHVRLEGALFDGVEPIAEGRLGVDHDRPGHGLSLNRDTVRRYESSNPS